VSESSRDPGVTARKNHAKQLRLLVREVRSRIVRLQKERLALNQRLVELRKLESQAMAALARLAKPES
jgi:uncharacterized protein involved in exopolysaccharide biosynthesis